MDGFAQAQKGKMMSDLISRQWLMECVNEGWIKFDTEKDENRFIHLVRDIAPSAQPERKKGEWLELTNGNHTYVCSVCGRMLVNITDGKNNVAKHYPYCHCGADMRGGQD